MSSTTPGTSGMGKRRSGTAKRRSYTISSSSSGTSHGDSKRRKSKLKHRSSSSNTSSSSHSLKKHRYAKKKRGWSSDSSRSSGKNKSKKRRRRKSSSSESTPKRETKRKIKPKAKTVSESSGDMSSRDNNVLHKSRIETLRYSSVKTPKARKTSDRRDGDTTDDVQPLSAAMVSVAASQERVAKRPRLCRTLSAKESRGQEALSEGTSTYSMTAAEETLRSDEQNGVQNNMFRLAADQEQEASSSEDRSEKNMKRESNFTDDSAIEGGHMTDGEASHDTCKSESSSDSELEDNQEEPVDGAPQDPDLPPMEGQPPPPTNPELVAALADLIFDIIFEVLWHFIQPFVQPQHA